MVFGDVASRAGFIYSYARVCALRSQHGLITGPLVNKLLSRVEVNRNDAGPWVLLVEIAHHHPELLDHARVYNAWSYRTGCGKSRVSPS
jgi:hypothetical protein